MDNIGAVFLSDNVQVNDRTKHIDIRSKFVRELVMEDGALKVVFVRSEQNDSDMLTKNLQSELHQRHSQKLVCRK